MKAKDFFVFITAILLLSSVSFAVPGFPNQFYGKAVLDGAPAPDGAAITATINNVQYGSTTASGGNYSIIVDNPESQNTGKTIVFFINGMQAGTGTFTDGANTNLNLSATTPPPAPAPSGGSSGGGGGGGGGGSFPATGNVVSQPANQSNTSQILSESGSCTERWLCTDWSSCSDGLQTRACEDVNTCGTEQNKPLESQPCSTIGAGAAGISTEVPLLTAFAIGSPETTAAGALILVLIILALIIWFWKKKKSKSSKGQTNLKAVLSDNFGKK